VRLLAQRLPHVREGRRATEEPFLSAFPETQNADTQQFAVACLQLGDHFERWMTMFIGVVFMVIGGGAADGGGGG